MTTDHLTEAQNDGRACVVCGSDSNEMVPTGGRGSEGSQLFRCVGCGPPPIENDERFETEPVRLFAAITEWRIYRQSRLASANGPTANRR